jgi:hypothetical protein
MSLPSRFAGSITASFIGRVMRPLGGRSSTSIHFRSHSGSGSIVRPIASTPGRNCRADQRRCRRGCDRETGLLLSVYVRGSTWRRRVEFLDFMCTRTCISTSRRRGPLGSIGWRSGSRSCKESPCTAAPSRRSSSSGRTSMPSSKPIIRTPTIRLDQSQSSPALRQRVPESCWCLIPKFARECGADHIVVPAIE